jgi:hypothetical protein
MVFEAFLQAWRYQVKKLILGWGTGACLVRQARRVGGLGRHTRATKARPLAKGQAVEELLC